LATDKHRVPRRPLLRAGLGLAAAAALGRGARPLVSLGAQMQVQSCNPKLGVHTRLTDEVEEWKIKRTLAMVREMGARWAVEYFPWAYCQPEPRRYSWAHSDMVVAHAQRQGLTLIARLGYPPPWVQPEGSAPSLLPPDRFGDFAEFCGRFARRYRGAVDRVIIWNEPNLAQEWGFRPPDAGEYVAMLRLCYAALKAEDSSLAVLAGALAPMPSPTLDPLATDDLAYLAAMYDAGASAHFDALAVHAYGWVYPPDDNPAVERVNYRRSELLRALMAERGDAAKPVYVTEAGWNDHPRWTRAVSPADRLLYTQQAFDLAQSRWSWCEAVAMWAFRFPWPQRSYQDNFSFVTPDFTPRPVYDAVRRYASTCAVDCS
jgi:hypothetical protein